MSDSDEQEQKEAAALRRALDEGVGGEDVPADALEAAALLRYKSGHGELDLAAKQRGLDELLALQSRKKPARRRGLFAGLTLAAGLAASFTLLVVTRGSMAPPPRIRNEARPHAELIHALGAAAAKEPGSADKLEHELRPFRRNLLRGLRGERTGALQKRTQEWRAER